MKRWWSLEGNWLWWCPDERKHDVFLCSNSRTEYIPFCWIEAIGFSQNE